MRTRLSVIGAVLGLGVAVGEAVPAQASIVPADGALIKAGHDNQCLNVKGNSSADNTPVVQWACDDTARNEQFRVLPIGSGTYQIQAVNSGECLNVYRGASADGTPVNQFPCSDTGANNLWRFTPVAGRTTYRISSVQTGKCLNVYGNSSVAGTALVIYPCGTTSLNDQFYFPPATAAALGQTQAPPAGSPVAVAQAGDGSLDLAYVTDSGTLVRGRVADPGDLGGVQWETVPGTYSGGATLARQSDQATMVLDVRHADDGDVWQFPAYGGRTTPDDIGGSGTGRQFSLLVPPYLHAEGGNSRVTFEIEDGKLWALRQFGDATPYGQWRYVGGTDLVGRPVARSLVEGADVYVRDAAGHLRMAWFGYGQLTDFADLGGAGLVTGAPGTRDSDMRQLVAMRTVAGQVVTQEQNDDGYSWPGVWQPTPDVPAAGDPVVADDGAGHEILLVRGTDDLLHASRATPGGWSPWVVYDSTPVASDPSVAGSFYTARTATGGVLIAHSHTF